MNTLIVQFMPPCPSPMPRPMPCPRALPPLGWIFGGGRFILPFLLLFMFLSFKVITYSLQYSPLVLLTRFRHIGGWNAFQRKIPSILALYIEHCYLGTQAIYV